MKKIKFVFLFIILLGHEVQTHAQQWIVYRDTNSGLPFNWVNKIKIDRHDNKWLLDGNANLIKFDNTNWTVYNYTNSGFPAQGGKAITMDNNDNKWIATSVGLVMFDGTNWVKYDSSNSCLPTNDILDCDVDTSGNIWLATDLGIVNFDISHNCTLHTSSNGNALGGIPEVKVDSRNWVWTFSNPFTGSLDVSTFNGSVWKNYSAFSIGPNVAPSHLFCDSTGNVWGSSYNGIFQFDGSIFSVPFDTSINGSFYNIGSVYSNNLFIAAASLATQTLNYFNGTFWNYYNFTNSPLNHLIFDFDSDKYGNLWIAGENGVYEFNPNGIINGVSESQRQFSFSSPFPNPSKGSFSISIEQIDQLPIEFTLYNVFGQKINCIYITEIMEKNNGILTMDIQNLPNGVYYYNLYGKNFGSSGKILLIEN